jgi:hypothetical protein
MNEISRWEQERKNDRRNMVIAIPIILVVMLAAATIVSYLVFGYPQF